MTDITPKPADSPQKNFSDFIDLNNRIAMLGIGFVCAILAMSIANGLDMLRSVIIPTPHYLREIIGMRYGMQIWGICQDASQLKRIYGDGWETFISNAGMIQYFGSRDRISHMLKTDWLRK